MLFEHKGYAINELYGKPWVGNKLCLHTQIRMSSRATRWKYAVNRLRKWTFPNSRMSIEDYAADGGKIIVCKRLMTPNVLSLMRRQKMTERQAFKLWWKCEHLGDEIMARWGCLELWHHEFVRDPMDCILDMCNYLDLEVNQRMFEAQIYNTKYPDYGLN